MALIFNYGLLKFPWRELKVQAGGLPRIGR